MDAERARPHDKTFELDDSNAGPTASVCRRLDGRPLAIKTRRCTGSMPRDLEAEALR